MKKSLTQVLGVCAALLMLTTACKKDEVQAVYQINSVPVLTASASTFVLLENNSTTNAVTYTWTKPDPNYPAVITYTVQFDKKGGDFSSPVTFDAGTALTKTLTVSELNSAFQGKGLVPATTTPVPTQMDVRVIGSIGGNTATMNSEVQTFTATPYAKCEQPVKGWTMIGPAVADWSTDVTMTYDCTTKLYTYRGFFAADDFKFRFGKDWAVNLGDGGTGDPFTAGRTLISTGNPPNLHITTAGTYTITLSASNLSAATYTLRP